MNVKEIEYKNISASVRTPKVVTFISCSDPIWQHTVSIIIEWYSKMWGGNYNLIIPTDGETLDDRYWKLLESYDPDYLYLYRYSLSELISADPERYKKTTQSMRDQLTKQASGMSPEEIENYISHQADTILHHNFKISDKLEQELKHRLSPFYFQDHIVKGSISWKSDVTYPLTKITKIVKHSNYKDLFLVNSLKDVEAVEAKLLIVSQTGYPNAEYIEEIKGEGVAVDTMPDNYPYNQILRDIIKGVDIKDQQFEDRLSEELGSPKSTEWRPNFNYLDQTIFKLSSLALGEYHKVGDHKDWEEPVVLIVGDTIDDFCYYYSLSKAHCDFFWIPNKFIEKFKKALPKTKRPEYKFTVEESIAYTIINALYSKVDYGHNEKKIILSSISLDQKKLENAKKALVKACLSPDIEKCIVTNSTYDFTQCIRLVIELDNYSNQQTQTFLNGTTVGRIETPKPKNFNYIDPSEHKWITELSIDGYKLPKLHFIGHKVIDLDEARDVRASKEGISYHCPNIGYFGGEIDAVLVKPKMKLIEPIKVFEQYYYEAGFKRVAVSDKGLLTKRAIDKFGSLDRLGWFLLNETNRNLIEKFLSKSSTEDKGTGAEIVYVNDRSYLNFKQIAATLGSKQASMVTIDELTVLKVLHRGLIFKCEECLKSDWYDISKVTKTFTCSRCSHTQVYERFHWRSPEEPSWYYKLDEVVREGFIQHMDVPIMTLFQLKQQSKDSFLFSHELSLWKELRDPPGKPDLEIDLNCIVDGQIIIGESKIDSITTKEVNKYGGLVKILKRHPDRIIFSTFKSSWSDDINNEIKKINCSEILTKDDLLKRP